MFQFVMQHQFWTAVVLYWIYSAAVSSMPDPGTNTNPGYAWLFRFLHTIAGNLTTAFSGKIPGMKSLLLLLIVPLALTTQACAIHYDVHPGALNQTDSAAYDTLLIAETTIDQARLDFQSGQLPATAKPALDALIQSYNIARASWLTYRGAISANTPADMYFTQLNQNLTDLATAIRKLEEAK